VFARFRYIDLKEAARGCGGRGPLWELNGVEWCCEGTPGLCGRARQTAPGAWKVAGAKKCREQSVWGNRQKRFVWRQSTGDGACRNSRSIQTERGCSSHRRSRIARSVEELTRKCQVSGRFFEPPGDNS